MSKSNDGGPAFGEFQKCGDMAVRAGGMTLRDYFAAKALAAMLSNTETIDRLKSAAARDMISADVLVATGAYVLADAMLAEREKADRS